MKTVLMLSLVCAAAVLSGCSSTNQGGASDTYNSSTGNVHMSGPTTTDPSLPQNDWDYDVQSGPQIPPP